MPVRQRRCDYVMGWRGFQWFLGQKSSCRMGCNGLHGKEVAARSHRRACAGVCVFFVLSLACTKQAHRAPVHVQVCTLYRCLLISIYIFGNIPSAGRARAPVYSQFLL